MAIYITGDTHGIIDRDKLNKENFRDEVKLTRDDYVIILGDFGVPGFGKTLENSSELEFYKNKSYTVLFVEGNHENFNILDNLPVSMWHGGKVHYLADNVIHLMRGQIYNICGKKFFTFGGAYSPDKYLRVPGYTWFQHESSTYAEQDEALDNLAKESNKVDYILTHTCGSEYMQRKSYRIDVIFNKEYQDTTEVFLDYIEQITTFKKWFFGHYHRDCNLDNKHRLVYNHIIRL